MKPTTRKALTSVAILFAMASTGALYAQGDKPAEESMMHKGPGAMMHGGSGDMMGMMQMMSQMSQMMESCNTMMESMASQPRSEQSAPEGKER